MVNIFLNIFVFQLNSLYQRICSIFLYTIPLKASIPYGYYLFYKYSFLKFLAYLTFPVILIENSLPFGGLLLFLIIFAGVVRNPKIPYFIRFNGCQALLLEVALIIFSYVLRIIQFNELGLFLFITTVAIFIFSFVQCLYGIEPEIPFISKSARMQIN